MKVRALARHVFAVVAVASLSGAGLGALTTPAAAATSTAVVVVDTGGAVYKQTITFDGAIDGVRALQLANASPVTLDYGPPLHQAVCQLLGVGDAVAPSS